MTSNDRAIKVAELKPGEAGKGIARLDPELMNILGLKVGDIALVIGNKKTAVKILSGPAEDANRGIIRLDGSTRRNAGISLDERVDVKKAETKEAEKITFFMYEEILAFKRAAKTLGLTKADVEKAFYSNAKKLIDGARADIYGA